MISGPAAHWLRAQREDLNLRVRLARHRGCEPDTSVLVAWLNHLLPVLGAQRSPDALLSAAFDLVLTLAGKRRLAPPGATTSDAQAALLDLLPELSRVFAQQADLLAAFSNAAGNLAEQGMTFVRALPALAAVCPVADLPRAGALLAWRLGECRLRRQALRIAAELPAEIVAVAMAVTADQVPTWLNHLQANSWRPPGRTPQRGASLGVIGDFQGLGGAFATQPHLLASSRDHCLQLQCGATRLRVEVDAFGWRCLPTRDHHGEVSRPRLPTSFHDLTSGTDSWVVLPTSDRPQVLACTHPDSFRIRIVDLGAT